MKYIKSTAFIFVVSILAISITAKANSYKVKADAAIKTQQGVVVRSANLTSEKVIVVPKKETEETSKSNSAKKSSLSRGGSMNSSLAKTSGNSSVVAFASKFLGRPYVWGASGPRAFDCSGFTAYVYSNFGVYLDHYTGSQFGTGKSVSRDNLSPGDLVFFNTYGSISHVGIYMGDGRFIHAANERTGVTISNLDEGYYSARYAGARRVK